MLDRSESHLREDYLTCLTMYRRRQEVTTAKPKPDNGDRHSPLEPVDTSMAAYHAEHSYVRDEVIRSVHTSRFQLIVQNDKRNKERHQLTATRSLHTARVLESGQADAPHTSFRARTTKLSAKNDELMAQLESDNEDEMEGAKSRVECKKSK